MNESRRREKRRQRELRARRPPEEPQVRVVYRAKTPEEGARRAARAEAFHEPFQHLPGNPEPKTATAFVTTTGYPVDLETIEMIWNDALLCDAVSDHGKDGPLYEQTLDSPEHKEAWEWAKRAYAAEPLENG